MIDYVRIASTRSSKVYTLNTTLSLSVLRNSTFAAVSICAHCCAPARDCCSELSMQRRTDHELASCIRRETDIYMHHKYRDTRYIHTLYVVYSCVWRLWVVFLEHGGGALGIFKSPACIYNQAWTFSLSASHYCPILSKRSGRRMPPAERSAL